MAASAMRGNLFTAIQTRLLNLGYIVSASEVYACVDDVENVVAGNVNAQTDASSDLGVWPVPPQGLET
jgi:hypothetical protein